PNRSPAVLKEALTNRGGRPVSWPCAASVGRLRYQRYTGERTPALFKELMGDLGNPVGSIEEEMARIKGTLFNDIQGVAGQLAESMKADDAAKRAKIAMLLYPLCFNPLQVENLAKTIKNAQGGSLAALLEDEV